MKRHDRPGHINPAHAERLLEWSRRRYEQGDDDAAFLRANAEEDDLGSELGQTTVASMTSGAAVLTYEFEDHVDEEVGGPFVVTSTQDEFYEDIDLSDLDLPRPAERPGEREDESPPSGTRSWAAIDLPRAKAIAAWLSKRMTGGPVATFARVFRQKAS